MRILRSLRFGPCSLNSSAKSTSRRSVGVEVKNLDFDSVWVVFPHPLLSFEAAEGGLVVAIGLKASWVVLSKSKPRISSVVVLPLSLLIDLLLAFLDGIVQSRFVFVVCVCPPLLSYVARIFLRTFLVHLSLSSLPTDLTPSGTPLDRSPRCSVEVVGSSSLG